MHNSSRLTPEERAIIERTRREGEELYLREKESGANRRRTPREVVGFYAWFVIVFILLVVAISLFVALMPK